MLKPYSKQFQITYHNKVFYCALNNPGEFGLQYGKPSPEISSQLVSSRHFHIIINAFKTVMKYFYWLFPFQFEEAQDLNYFQIEARSSPRPKLSYTSKKKQVK